MSILSGFKKYKDYILTSSGYQLSSRWTKSDAVVMGDGTDDTNTLEKNLGSIQGITDSLTATSSNVALSAAGGNNLQSQIDTLNSNLTDVNNSLSNVGVLDWDNAVDINISLTGNTSYTPTKRGIYFGCVQANDSTNVTFSITDVLTNKIMSYMNVPKGWLRESIIVPLNANREIIINVVNGNTCLFSYFVPFK